MNEEKENSNSINEVKPLVFKNEQPGDIECEVILYVDNREKKN